MTRSSTTLVFAALVACRSVPPAAPPSTVPEPAAPDPARPTASASAPSFAASDDGDSNPPTGPGAAPVVAMPPLASHTPAKIMPYPPSNVAPLAVTPAPPSPITRADPSAAALATQIKQVDRAIAAGQRLLPHQRGADRFRILLELAGHYARRADLTDARAERDNFRAKAIARYGEAAAPAFTNQADYDEALFQYGAGLLRAGDTQAAMPVLRDLIKNRPNSRRIPDTYLAFADYYFDSAQLDVAGNFYQKVVAFPDTPLQAYARYKLAWVYINQSDHRRALEELVRVIALAATRPDDAALGRSARQDLVYCYAQVGAPNKALPFFRRIDPGAAAEMLERLGELYGTQGKLDDQIAVRRGQLRDQPGSLQRCRWQLDIVDATATASDRAAELRELSRLAAVRDQLATDPSASVEPATCDAATEHRLVSTARQWHREAQATRDPAAAAAAAALYQLYLDRFSTRAEALAQQYYLGDALWLQAAGERRPTAALPAYHRAAAVFAQSATSAPPGTGFLDDAIAGALAGYQNAIAIAEALSRAAPELRSEAAGFLDWVARDHPDSPSAAAAAALRATLPTR